MAFRFDKLTIKAQEAVQHAQELAADAGNPQIEPLHLLAALIVQQEGIVRHSSLGLLHDEQQEGRRRRRTRRSQEHRPLLQHTSA